MVEFGVSVLKGISGNKHTEHFVLYDQSRRDQPLRSIIARLPTDVQRQFIIDKYPKSEPPYPCIRPSASGESTNSVVVVYSSLVVVYSTLTRRSFGFSLTCVHVGELWGGGTVTGIR